jgi:hypothetical protein
MIIHFKVRCFEYKTECQLIVNHEILSSEPEALKYYTVLWLNFKQISRVDHGTTVNWSCED